MGPSDGSGLADALPQRVNTSAMENLMAMSSKLFRAMLKMVLTTMKTMKLTTTQSRPNLLLKKRQKTEEKKNIEGKVQTVPWNS